MLAGFQDLRPIVVIDQSGYLACIAGEDMLLTTIWPREVLNTTVYRSVHPPSTASAGQPWSGKVDMEPELSIAETLPFAYGW